MFVFSVLVTGWMACMLVGMLLLVRRQSRRAAVYLLLVPTSTLLFSLLISTIVLMSGPMLVGHVGTTQITRGTMAAYAVAALVGALIGAAAGVAAARKVLRGAHLA